VFPSELGHVFADLHRAHDVDVRLGTGVAALEGDDRVTGVRLTDGTVIAADVVVVGIGVTPTVEWLDGSGVPLGNGVHCDSTLRAAPGIVAAGDVADFHNDLFGERMRVEHWDTAIASGAAAARRLLAEASGEQPAPFSPVPWFWSDQYDRKIQMAGRPSATDEVVLLEGGYDQERFAVAFRRGDECRGVLAVNRPRAVVMAQMKMAESLSWDHVFS
jgi:NADPH-dependent 2,4-dienoyl-CoA reductase/sulfur reductase-like enzyme